MKSPKSHAETMRDNAKAMRRAALSTQGIMHNLPLPDLLPEKLSRKESEVVRTEPSESEIRRDIMKLLKHHPKIARCWTQASGTFQFQNDNGSKRFFRANSARGMADIQFILKGSGRAGFIEVKTKRGIVAEHQQEFLDSMNQAGSLAFVARDIDDVLSQLENLP